jgi:hypothetical protein
MQSLSIALNHVGFGPFVAPLRATVVPSLLNCHARSCSHSNASPSASSVEVAQTPARPVGLGFGFPKRYKEMSDTDLGDLLSRSEPFKKDTNGPKKMRSLVPLHHTGQHAHQWTKLDRMIDAPYQRHRINQTDMFAVIEAGATQFKGTSAL